MSELLHTAGVWAPVVPGAGLEVLLVGIAGTGS